MANLMPLQENFDLTPFNAFAVRCRARWFAEARTGEGMAEALEAASAAGLPVLVLGAGSNLLFTGDYPGLVLHVGIPGMTFEPARGSGVMVRCGAGENWHQLVMSCLQRGLGGIENLALIPGTVGAAPVQNIGAYGVELQDVFHELEAVDMASGRSFLMSSADCEFGYRDSVFKNRLANRAIIVSVALLLDSRSEPNTQYLALRDELAAMGAARVTPALVAEAVMSIRRRKLPDPAVLPNCGSFFKNPVVDRACLDALAQRFGEVPAFSAGEHQPGIKIPAAWLLDKLGWKGRRTGPVGVHRDQAVVVVNYGGATGKQIQAFARDMQDSVEQAFGIRLEPEVRII